jgi:hypothetical protein
MTGIVNEEQRAAKELEIWGSVANRKRWEHSQMYPPKKKRMWKTSDYAWIGVALVIIIVIVAIIIATR